MDSLDRTYAHLVKTIRAQFPQYVSQPFDVAELYQTILPYRHHRRDLGLDSNEDYEIVLTELLSGARDYLIVDDLMRDKLRAELATPNPDPSAFKEFGDTTVALSPAALRKLEGVLTDPAPAPARPAPRPAERPASIASLGTPIQTQAAEARPAAVSTPAPPAPAPAPVASTPAYAPLPGEKCRSCDGALPVGRAITFCPHCGQNLKMTNCQACGSELELSWKYCPVCGRPGSPIR